MNYKTIQTEIKTKFILLLLAVSVITAAKPVNVAEIDKNFKEANVGKRKILFYNALEKPFKVSGFPWREPGHRLYRLPESFTTTEVNKNILFLANHTAGGVIRFRSDSPRITLRAVLHKSLDMSHMPRNASAGFDVFLNASKNGGIYFNTVRIRGNNLRGKSIQATIVRSGKKGQIRNWSIYLPLYSGVKKLEIGIIPGSKILAPKPQKITKPILFYGSSITQGGCASRPANCYTTLLCRILDAPQINLGFSGNAKGEIAIAKAIAKLDLAAFVYDYDYNAPDAQHLDKTHEAFFKVIRKANPDLPILILSKCSRPDAKRRNVVKKTYDNAVAAGDKNVYFIDGATLFGNIGSNYCTVDGCHPNDLGFYTMYQNILPVLKKALKLKR